MDGTLGMGGHTRVLLQMGGENIQVLGIDQDSQALDLSRRNLEQFGGKVHFYQMSFTDFETALDRLGGGKLDGALLDLGVSSLHLDDPRRGFSFLKNGPLDMRMAGKEKGETAADIVNSADRNTLRDIIREYGEEPMAGRIATAIIKAREEAPLEGTQRLARVVAGAYPAKRRAKSRNHPATKTFQALRIAVNRELEVLEDFLEKIIPRLASGARVVVISFHSLEDRIVKWFFRREARDCICPRGTFDCQCGHEKTIRILTKKPVQASQEEKKANHRSRSAKLRAAEKL